MKKTLPSAPSVTHPSPRAMLSGFTGHKRGPHGRGMARASISVDTSLKSTDQET